MAADEARMCNMFLEIKHFQPRGSSEKLPLAKNHPYIGARRASDENNARRTTLLELAMAFGLQSGAWTLPQFQRALAEKGLTLEVLKKKGSHFRHVLDTQEPGPDWRDERAILRQFQTGSGNPLDEGISDIEIVNALIFNRGRFNFSTTLQKYFPAEEFAR